MYLSKILNTVCQQQWDHTKYYYGKKYDYLLGTPVYD